MDTLVGTRIGDFIVRERVGTGGMGVVYRGEHPLIGASVALKVLRPEAAGDPEQVQRLQDEARLVNAIRHRGIVGIFNYFTLPAPDGRHCLMMEFLKGRSLEQELARRGGRLPLVEALGLYEQVCAALAAAHKAGVVHRDLKPSNIFLVEEHDQMYVKVLDFGIAKQSAVPYGFVAQTMVTRFMGTPGFVAPEQARAQPVGPGTDLYALGVCLFITLTGQTPFEAPTPYDLVRCHVEDPVPTPSSVLPGLPPAVDQLILSLMAKDPQSRPSAADVVRLELESIRLAASGGGRGNPQATRIVATPMDDELDTDPRHSRRGGGESTNPLQQWPRREGLLGPSTDAFDGARTRAAPVGLVDEPTRITLASLEDPPLAPGPPPPRPPRATPLAPPESPPTGPTFSSSVAPKAEPDEGWKRDARLIALGAGPVIFVVLVYWLLQR
ncbi:MAG: serine/threonine protein kinase [Deltaproteobacteria bacterium]|nr:serine/threonine protein kinase [Deltaproteobacteria bacterium]